MRPAKAQSHERGSNSIGIADKVRGKLNLVILVITIMRSTTVKKRFFKAPDACKYNLRSCQKIVSSDGTITRYLDGEIHCGCHPAIEHSNGTKHWYENGIRYRSDIHIAGDKFYKIRFDRNGKIHHDRLPAVVDVHGDQFYYNHGHIHRVGGPAIIRANGDMYWIQDSKLHNDDGPAVIGKYGDIDIKLWFQYGALYRKDGPAIEFSDGRTFSHKNTNLPFGLQKYTIGKEDVAESEVEVDDEAFSLWCDLMDADTSYDRE